MRVQEVGPRRNDSSAEPSRGPKMWFAIRGNVPGDSIDKDTHHESIGQREAIKYLIESCYNHIEYSVTNFLATLMRK